MTEKLKFVLGIVENVVGKGEKPGFGNSRKHHGKKIKSFSPFYYDVFKSCHLHFRIVTSRDCELKSYLITRRQNLDWSKFKEIAEDILNCI